MNLVEKFWTGGLHWHKLKYASQDCALNPTSQCLFEKPCRYIGYKALVDARIPGWFYFDNQVCKDRGAADQLELVDIYYIVYQQCRAPKRNLVLSSQVRVLVCFRLGLKCIYYDEKCDSNISVYFFDSYKFVALVEKEQSIPEAYPLNWFCSSKADGGLILKNQDEEFEWNCVLLLLFCVWLHWKRSLYVNSSSLAGKIGDMFYFYNSTCRSLWDVIIFPWKRS